MNSNTLKALGVTQKEIDALNVILNSAIPGTSVAVAHLQAALAALESAEAAEESKELATQKSNPPADAGKQHKPSGLDSLGGGTIL
ncbi:MULTISPECIES: hypothetical protein [Pseudomonas]|uniref:Uncharacterized protein n=1 Tax=Pseudomonas aphyarum TaxID=2942629 RepID=A0ABT5PNM2_9PSED|nr:hypothetical protein [Pseudomonas aphyarum]MDD0969867.1 hypothetical protein [Pseudomonas aphyarum]MDD1125072.1 hypothetical protein [Pseudomonas aphyarum]